MTMHPTQASSAWDNAASLCATSQHFCGFPQHLEQLCPFPPMCWVPRHLGYQKVLEKVALKPSN